MSKTIPKGESKSELVIVGIGASAGGLTALKTFFAQLPANTGLTFVVVVHLAPDYESHLADILQPHVPIPVQQVQETVTIEPNRVYIIPPGRNLSAVDTHLRLSELAERPLRRAPIDHFFRTLAATYDGHSIGVILSGTGSDGTMGMKDIKEQEGLTIVQDPNEAEYDGMPQSAVATGLIDLVLPVAEIPEAILRYLATQPRLPQVMDVEALPQDTEQQLLHKIFVQIRTRTGSDFSRYKPATILRRIARRMQLRRVEELADYVALLSESAEELNALAEDMLITVTSFFRDREKFEYIEKEIIPRLFQGKGAQDTIRLWSVGCATGEEAYSLAILLLEARDRHEIPPDIQVFASDLHEKSLRRAREGFYPGDIKGDVSEERLLRFFQQESGGYRIRKEVRELIVFTPHNLLSDPPFSRLDMITCRNVLIYLQREVQREVIELFHYALKPNGYLLLGISESIENLELFSTVEKKHCVFRKRQTPDYAPRLPSFPFSPMRTIQVANEPKASPETPSYSVLHQRLVAHYAPPSLLVSGEDKVVQLSAEVGRYLVLPGGDATLNVFKVVREELRIELRAALFIVRDRGESVRTKPIPVRFNGESAPVVMQVRPASDTEHGAFALIQFYEGERAPTREVEAEVMDSWEKDGVLAEELEHVKQQLQSVIEEYETSQEEMKASYEEMQSTNEELRSTLEELETSKEELQSMNEELATVNQENRHKVEELAKLTSDLHNLLSATEIATLFLDRKLRIMRFTPKLNELFNIRMSDRGRPLTDITHRLGYADLIQDARQVLKNLVPVEREVRDEDENVYLTRMLPYRSTEDRIEGVVLTFVDITQRVRAVSALRASEERYRNLFESIDEGFCIIEMIFENDRAVDYRFLETNPAFQTHTGLTGAVGKRMLEIASEHEPDWFEVYGRVARTGDPERFTGKADALDERWFDVYAFPVDSPADHRVAVLFRDITERRQMEENLHLAKEDAEQAARAKADFLAHMSHEIRTPLNTILGFTELMLILPQEELRDNLRTLKRSAADLKILINDILDFSKIQSGKVTIEETAVDLPRLLNDLSKAQSLLAKERGNELHIAIDENIPRAIYTDSVKLKQVLRNLISNALKFTEAGRVEVAVTLDRREADRLWLTFAVADTGIGIAEEKLANIFDAFVQADASTERKYGGTGLGLSISQLLLELMNSQIHVETEVGKGSRFYFSIAVRAGKPSAAATPMTDTGKTESLPAALSVLVVEDTQVNRKLLVRFLQNWWELTPDEAENGEQAIARAKERQYQMILMDLHMPVLDGYQAAREIRQLPGYADVPILALTADTVSEVERHAEAGLFDRIVTKPFDMEQLRATILRLSDRADR